nr:response regulator [Corallococcus sp. CA053C]
MAPAGIYPHGQGGWTYDPDRGSSVVSKECNCLRRPQGLTLALSHEYDVIVLDLMLPGMSGIELCRHYRQLAPRLVPVLMLAARDMLEDKEEGFRAGADDYLVKPFSLRELRLRLEALARRPWWLLTAQEAETGFGNGSSLACPPTPSHRQSSTQR